MNQIAQKVLEPTIEFSSPVTANSPELQQLFDFIALGAAERDRQLRNQSHTSAISSIFLTNLSARQVLQQGEPPQRTASSICVHLRLILSDIIHNTESYREYFRFQWSPTTSKTIQSTSRACRSQSSNKAIALA